MKAVACFGGRLDVVEVPDPRPAKGQLVLTVRRCGICGSDLHAKDHADELADVMSELDYDDFMRTSNTVVLGHEFCGEVAQRGPGVGPGFREGSTVVSFPLLRAQDAVHP